LRSRFQASVMAGALLLAPLLAQGQGASVYEVRPFPQGRVALEVLKTGIWSGKKHLFLFQKYAGTVRFDPASPENSTVQLTIEGGSAVCQDTWVSSSDLRSIQNKAWELMDVARHPQLVFSSERIVAFGSNRFQVHGFLVIRAIAKPAVVTVVMVRQDEETLLFNGGAEVRLKDYGLKAPNAALGLIGTADEMHLEFALRGTRVR
jgi:polyisoprenoid-binding protein YceI